MRVVNYKGVEVDMQVMYVVRDTQEKVGVSEYAKLMYLYKRLGNLPVAHPMTFVDEWFKQNATMYNISD